MTETDVIVVGAGVSGLSAARLLTSQRGLKVLVLEATDRVGGRAYTYVPGKKDPQYGWADVGGALVSDSHVHVMRMCKELGLKTQHVSEELDSIFIKGQYHKTSDWYSYIRWRHPLAAWDLAVMVQRLEKMCWEVPVDKPWEAPRAREWDNMTVKQFYDKHCWTKFANDYLMFMVKSWTASRGSHMSLLYYLWEMRLANGTFNMWGLNDPEGHWKVILGGMQQVPDTMALTLGKSVILNQPVVNIKYGTEGVNVQSLHGKEYKAKYLILTAPAITHMKIHFDPPLPTMLNCLIQRSAVGLIMKSVVFYREPFWKAKGCSGFVSCMDENEMVSAVDADNPSEGGLFSLSCYIYQENMLKLSQMSEEKKQAEVCHSLARFFSSKEALMPVKFLYKVWSSEPYLCGGYTSYFPPGVLTSVGPAMRAPIGGRIFLAGTDTATHYRSYVNGAIDAGQRAAREVLHAEGHIEGSEVWVQEPPVRYEFSFKEALLPTIESVIRVLSSTLALGTALLVYWLIN